MCVGLLRASLTRRPPFVEQKREILTSHINAVHSDSRPSVCPTDGCDSAFKTVSPCRSSFAIRH